MTFWIVWIISFIGLINPYVDNYLDSVMTLHILIQIPLLVILGYLLKWKVRWNLDQYNHYGLLGLIFFVGTFFFWMIPHSVDLTVMSDTVDLTMHINMILAGFAFGKSHHIIPFPLKAALGIYSLSMIIAMGFTYLNYNSLLCATYSLDQQKELGYYLLLLSPILFIVLILWTGFTLNKEWKRKV